MTPQPTTTACPQQDTRPPTTQQPDHMAFDKPWTCTPSVDFKKGTITLDIQDWSGRTTKEIMQTKEQAIRQALIALGWTPPTEPPARMEEKE